MLGHMKDSAYQTFDMENCKRDVFVCTIKGAVHSLFYDLLRINKLHNENVRAENNKIVQFYIGDITTQETERIRLSRQQ